MKEIDDTIAAISTAQGLGGIGVIRVSGEDAIKICNSLFKSITGAEDKLLQAKGYTAHYGMIESDSECIDDAIVTVFRAPSSYTGEDVIEISCHGGFYVARRILSLLIKKGARLANSGEFTKRAFLNGKMNLTQAEAVMDIISASGQSAARAAQAARSGRLYKKIEEIKNDLIDISAHLSAWIDYPDEDIAEVSEDLLKDRLNQIKKKTRDLISTYEVGKTIKEGVHTIIVGKPNVGKSSIMNLITGSERSIVTDVPGTTRDIIEETVLMNDIHLRLADTAGIHNTADSVEKIGIDKAKDEMNLADLILIVFDGSRELTQDDFNLIEMTKNKNTIAIVNKSDLKTEIDIDYIKRQYERVVSFSVANETGLKDLSQEIENLIGLSKVDPSEGILSTQRQKEAANKTYDCINKAERELNNGLTFDAVSVLIEDAIEGLLELTGDRVTETIMDRVFSNFCVGK